MTDAPFTPHQQDYLKGLLAGAKLRQPADPTDLQRAAQDRAVAAGKKLAPEEEAKRRRHPLDRIDEISALAEAEKFPKGLDVFLTKYHGLFYVAPAQNAYMCRLRIPGGILSAYQFRGLADIADDLAGGYADITTRANLQFREIPAANAAEMLFRLSDLGLTSRGAGADNVRNITASPTAGIDPQELIDTRPHARAIHHHILARRELYGLPRKFNIAFDGGGSVAVLEDTNDIAFTAIRVGDRILYRLGLGGITGHGDFARETGIAIEPADTTKVCDAILRVFIAHGNRTDRGKARLKYLLDDWGLDKFITEVEKTLGTALPRATATHPRPPQDRLGHIGIHPQKGTKFYIGVLGQVGRLTSLQMRGLADIAEKFGSGTIRLTVWQNLLISDITETAAACDAIHALGLQTQAPPLHAGLIACTGNAGCKFAASNTKAHAAQLVAWLQERITVTRPLNIHLTGCHNSCAQHYIADIGLLGAKIEINDQTHEGYDLHVGGGAGPDQKIGRLIKAQIPFSELPGIILAMLEKWPQTISFQKWSESIKAEPAFSEKKVAKKLLSPTVQS